MKKFNQLAKTKRLQIYLSSIKTKVAVKFPKKLFFSFFCAENWLGAERVKWSSETCKVKLFKLNAPDFHQPEGMVVSLLSFESCYCLENLSNPLTHSLSMPYFQFPPLTFHSFPFLPVIKNESFVFSCVP